MIPLLPANTHLDFARELTEKLDRVSPETWSDSDFSSNRYRELRPDPLYLAMNRLWTKVANLFSNGFRRPV